MLKFDLSNYKLKGKVKSVIHKTFYTLENEIYRERFAELSWKFNEFGFITHSISIEYSGLVNSNYIFLYNEKNQCIERQFIYNNQMSSKDVYKYDNSGRMFESAFLRDSDYILSREEIVYDDKNNMQTKIFIHSSGKIRKKEISYFDIKKRLKVFEVIENNKFIGSYKYFYPNDFTKEVEHFDENKILSMKSKVVRDNFENIAEEIDYSTDNKEKRYRIQKNIYNEKKELIEEISGNRTELVHWKRVYHYDEFGNKIHEAKYLPEKSKIPEIQLYLDSVTETSIDYY